MVQAISDTEPRFTLFRYAHTHGGQDYSPVLFFYTCPTTPGNRAIKSRMMYPLMKRAVILIVEKQAGLSLEKKFEVEEPSEITENMVTADLHPQAEVRQAFSRPKRPGR
jgi:twinfilin